MNGLKIYGRQSFWIITGFGMVFSAIIGVGLYACTGWFLRNFSSDKGGQFIIERLTWLTGQIEYLNLYFYKLILPIMALVVLLAFGLLWLSLKRVASHAFATLEKETASIRNKPGKAKKDFIDQKIEQGRKRRLFLHGLSVLQRDGRLLDFFNEDLSLYDDGQIGAAVRSIHEDCKKSVQKYINPKPIIDMDEGEIVTIESGFDIDSVKLVGNVSGDPPFKGVLKHGGWKAGKKEIPKLSDIRDTTVITPAEVEIK